MKKNLFAAEPRTEQAEAREVREPQTRRLVRAGLYRQPLRPAGSHPGIHSGFCGRVCGAVHLL